MKKITIYILITASFVLTNQSIYAQAFEKGNINIDLGIGFGIYGTSQTTTTQITIPGVSIPATTDDTTDAAASMVIPISFEYGLTDKIGLGADLTISNYIISDSDKVNLSSVKGFDFGPRFNFHPFSDEKNDFFIGLGLGFSSIKWNYVTDPSSFIESASGSGIYYAINVSDRYFITDHVGVLFNISYRGYNYSGIETKLTSEAKSSLSQSGANFSQKTDWKFNGVNLGIGLAVKF